MRASILAVLVFGLLVPSALAGATSVGDRLEPFTLEDQFGESHAVDESVRLLLFSRDMKGGSYLKDAIEAEHAERIRRGEWAYVADISGMPRLIARIFAIPRMRRRPYPLLLDREGKVTASLPDREEQATLIHLDHLRITRIEHLPSTEAVKEALDRALRGADDAPPTARPGA